MILFPLHGDALRKVWGAIVPYARMMAARWPDDWPVAEIARQAMTGDILLWLIWEETERRPYGMVGTTVFQKASGKRILDIPLMAGHERERWLHLLPQIEAHGRSLGCTEVQIYGRAGWARALKGYRAVSPDILLVKDLGNGEPTERSPASGQEQKHANGQSDDRQLAVGPGPALH